MIKNWYEVPIGKEYDQSCFDCGDRRLNQFLHTYARQNHEKGGLKTYLAVDEHSKNILGYYSVTPASILYDKTSEVIKRRLAIYNVPVLRLVKLAVDISVQGKGFGSQLFLAAGKRCLYVAAQTGDVALLIDAKNEEIMKWYSRYGAIPLTDCFLTLLLPFSTLHAALSKADKL